jgi:Dehydrogenase E1 component
LRFGGIRNRLRVHGVDVFDAGPVRLAETIGAIERMTMISPRSLSPASRRERTPPSAPPSDVRLALYRSMLRIWRIEERIQALYPQGDMRCPTHFSIGQEAVAAGVCRNPRRKDYVISAHRSHAHYISKALQVAPIRVTLPDSPTPTTRALSNYYYPTPAHIVTAARRTLGLPHDYPWAGIEPADKTLDVPNKSFTGPF